jgi:uncharacterized protein (TIGR00375 family)
MIMKVFADLHIHSKYSRATSKEMDIEHLSRFGKQKGLNLIGTGDFTHPLWLDELKKNLAGDRIYEHDNGIYEHAGMNFVLTAEISNIYSTENGLKKIHHVLIAPDFEVVDQINDHLAKRGNLKADGRPIFGKYSSMEMVQDMMSISRKIMVIPAHIWTPWFSLFGSMSGFDSIDDCYGDQVKHIFALETGLSSDPEMNWRLSTLDRFTLVSNSDSHSPWPLRMGRECNVLDIDLGYDNLIHALKTREGFLFTIETDPLYGKYHLDGHRACDVCMSPDESIKNKNICPKCGRKLTIGVLHRIEELADRPEGFKPSNAVPFVKLLPLKEIIAAVLDMGTSTAKVGNEYRKLILAFGNEFNVLLDAKRDEMLKAVKPEIADAIISVRKNEIEIEPGYDGVYGKPIFRAKTKEESGLNKWIN